MQDVEQFASHNNLRDIQPLLQRGALAAQSPEAIDSISELQDAERQNLHDEVTYRCASFQRADTLVNDMR